MKTEASTQPSVTPISYETPAVTLYSQAVKPQTFVSVKTHDAASSGATTLSLNWPVDASSNVRTPLLHTHVSVVFQQSTFFISHVTIQVSSTMVCSSYLQGSTMQ